ncbi:nitrogenase iron-molybdenum cofactor biosynthesis protein NifN [Arcobacter sp. FWKO B]|uniref:nitrogenase iron-molybdenum cofactor biosynthesis protein NifN n=1 Tax=Arcobacter sp. FWKO B TaxID=2593672 RepID=UPI0018A5A1C4|nr:nitrogenase iron-molybdenum cofactor biosynthesis protein NifN [Arcobacter sp. FWKO B]QOG11295.1 nitrogenase iron-molybdenum cofactor biosynthesis protein NifN [Arcobacter sp. FWKO B]
MQKPLQINPTKLSQPMGATLAFLGVKSCMPLMHGALGCASFTKVFFTRHFNDPIAMQTTAVNDITAVIDGGHWGVLESIKNITAKVTPALIGLHTTGLTETKGDDIRAVSELIRDEQPIVWVNTPDFEGGFESGFSKAVSAMIKQLIIPKTTINNQKALIIPNANLKPLEIEKIKEELELFGFLAFALPDISLSLDGHLDEKPSTLSSGGIELCDIYELGDSSLIITIGSSVKDCGVSFVSNINPHTKHLHFDSLSGLINSDGFYKEILEFKNLSTPHPKIIKWRKRLQDALLDTHFALGSTKFAVVGQNDEVHSICELLSEAGGRVSVAIVSEKSPINSEIKATNVIVGDFYDLEKYENEYEILITNFHGIQIARNYNKGLVLRGYPNYEEVGNSLKSDLLYEGSCYFLFEVANTIIHHQEHTKEHK